MEKLPWNQERLKRQVPVPVSMPIGYKTLLERERRQKPHSVTFRNEIIKKQIIANYKNEYDRLQGEIDSYANAFSGRGGSHLISKLKNRQSHLRNLFKEAHDGHKHPIEE
jgi:hypothetical protein